MSAVKNPDLIPLFEEAKKLLKPYEKKGLTPRKNEPGSYDLWSERDVVIDGRKKKGVYFAALIIQKHYVGFYFMPIYADTDLADVFGDELLSLLKGKSCFYLKELTPPIKKQMRDALRIGYELYEERGWA
jgi:hypothetical protein